METMTQVQFSEGETHLARALLRREQEIMNIVFEAADGLSCPIKRLGLLGGVMGGFELARKVVQAAGPEEEEDAEEYFESDLEREEILA